jgi:hypothetical protein
VTRDAHTPNAWYEFWFATAGRDTLPELQRSGRTWHPLGHEDDPRAFERVMSVEACPDELEPLLGFRLPIGEGRAFTMTLTLDPPEDS